MRAWVGQLRTVTTMALMGYAIVFVISAAQGPRLPAIEGGERLGREPIAGLVTLAQAAEPARQGRAIQPRIHAPQLHGATIGPQEAIRIHGGSVLTDLLSQ